MYDSERESKDKSDTELEDNSITSLFSTMLNFFIPGKNKSGKPNKSK